LELLQGNFDEESVLKFFCSTVHNLVINFTLFFVLMLLQQLTTWKKGHVLVILRMQLKVNLNQL